MSSNSEPEPSATKASARADGSALSRRLLFPGLAAAAAVGVAMAMAANHSAPTSAAAPPVGGPFRLIDQNGRSVDQHVLDGHWSAVFFGYTFCPDTCPATLQALGAAARRLGPRANTFQVLFITVDPERDTPAQLKTYLESQGFPARIVGLTGDKAAIATAARAYGVYYEKAGSGRDYTVDHSAAVYLMNPKGVFERPLSHDMAPDQIAAQILAAEGG